MRPVGEKLLVVSPVYNEGANLERTARAVAAQSLRPDRWVVVDDGSSDDTLAVARRLEAELDFMTVIEASHAAPPGVDNLALAREAHAFNFGLEHGEWRRYSFVGKLDGDVELPAEWFASLIERFEADQKLGLAGGRLVEPGEDGWKAIPIPAYHVHGAVKLFRRECLEAIGGVPERLAWDTIDETYARMRGFGTHSYLDLTARHHRAWGSADGRLRGRARHGECAWILHYGFPWVLLRSFKVAGVPPLGLSGLAFLLGYVKAAVRRVPRVDDRAFRRFVRGELRARMLSPLRGRGRLATVGEGAGTGSKRGRVLLISENAPVPGDRRVWSESRTLAEAGWQVAVVCAESADRREEASEVLDGVEIHRYPLRPAASTLGYAREYVQALWRIRGLVRRLQRDQPFEVVHAANPPDFLLLAARSARAQGARFVFDHHDLMPELFRSRFGRGGLPHRALLAIESRALRSADVVISTNESYRRIAIERGGVDPENVFVVRNGPDLERFQPVPPDPALRRGRRYLLAYLGMMGPQDGIDEALRALAALRGLREDDWHAVFVGEGEVRADMEALAGELGLAGSVEFAGWCGDSDIRRILSTADVCIAPDPPSPLNDVSTMIKVPEYMAIGCPIASYDLPETRFSAGSAAAYAAPTPEALGRCIHELLEDPARRDEMGQRGRERVAGLAWQQSSEVLLAAYEHATGREGLGVQAPVVAASLGKPQASPGLPR